MDKSIILIIEDEIAINDAIAEVARACNYDVIQAYNGKQALDILAQSKLSPALVICDMAMPTMDGIEFVKQSLIKNLDLNVCMITANDDKDQIIEVLRLGVADYISKPFEVEPLMEKIKLMVDMGKRKRAIKEQIEENPAVAKSIKLNNLLKVKNSQK